MAKPKLLFLSHRIPFPPNKGDKIRSFNVLKHLSETFDVVLGTFIDDPKDWQYESELSKYTIERKCLPLSRGIAAQARGAINAFVKHKPITLPCFESPQMQNWVNTTLKANHIEHVFIFCSSMAQYVEGAQFNALNRVIDFVDIDSDKWRQYSESKPWPFSAIYRREAKLLSKYEHKIANQFNNSLFVSPDEALQFKKMLIPQIQAKVHSVLNGVDLSYFTPTATLDTPTGLLKTPYIVFTGAMDYWANEEAILWFSEHVWPTIEKKLPHCHLYIVGGSPSSTVKNLRLKSKRIIVTGRVEDIRPYIKHSLLAVAPLRIARGIQNKVLEAMAMAKPVVMTNMAAEGIELPPLQHDKVTDDSAEMSVKIIELINTLQTHNDVGTENLNWINQKYQWSSVLNQINQYFPVPNEPEES